jgi:hypothetical protein
MPTTEINELQQAKTAVYDYCRNMLGDGMVDVELDLKHYETALERALGKYRQRGDSSVEESYMFLTTVEDQNTYILPKEVIEVRQIFRRSIGSRTGSGQGGTVFEPFNMAYTNTYLLSSSNMGGILTYELFAQYQELVGRMFGSFIEFKWHQQSHKLTMLQRPRNSDEELLLYCYNYRPDIGILNDMYATQWVKDYTLANCKVMLGQAREKFAQIAGPQGGTSLNGATLKAEGAAEIERLEAELATQVAGGRGYTFIIG